MSPLEATVEIVKTILGTTTINQAFLVTNDENRKKLLAGIEAIYKKLEELENQSAK